VKKIQSELDNGQLRTPTAIPKKIQMIKEDEQPPSTGVAGVVGGVPGGVPGGTMGGVLGGMLSSTPVAIPKAAPQRVRVSQGVSQGLLIRKVTPIYPALARQARIQGTVVLQALIGKDGAIQNLRVATVGGVIRTGEPLAELIPDEDNLVINAEVSPTDADAIDGGMQAEIRFTAFHGYTLPLMLGHVESVSRDRLTDEQSKQSYFLARVVVDQKDIPAIVQDHIKAGMPVEVMVPTGERTVMSYLIRPLRNRAVSAFREK